MFREPIFTGRANPLRRLRASSPEGGAFNEIASFALQPETLPPCQRLPPRGSWQNRQVLTEGVRPLPAFSGGFYFTQRIFAAGFYPLAPKKYALFFSLPVVYA